MWSWGGIAGNIQDALVLFPLSALLRVWADVLSGDPGLVLSCSSSPRKGAGLDAEKWVGRGMDGWVGG